MGKCKNYMNEYNISKKDIGGNEKKEIKRFTNETNEKNNKKVKKKK